MSLRGVGRKRGIERRKSESEGGKEIKRAAKESESEGGRDGGR